MQNKNKYNFLKLKSLNLGKLLTNLLIICLGLKVFIAGAFFLIPQQSVIAQSANIISPEKLVILTNQTRAKSALPPLIVNQQLNEAAAQKAGDMLQKGYFMHTAPEGKAFDRWIQEAGYQYRSAGENLAIYFVNNEDIITAWMNSPTHAQNISDPQFQEIGIAALSGDFAGEKTTVVVQLFGEPLKTTPIATLENASPLLNANNIILHQADQTKTPSLHRFNTYLNITLIVLFFALSAMLTERITINHHLDKFKYH